VDLTEFDWPEMQMIGVQVQTCAPWSGLRDVGCMPATLLIRGTLLPAHVLLRLW
jgi:hypothetical protein